MRPVSHGGDGSVHEQRYSLLPAAAKDLNRRVFWMTLRLALSALLRGVPRDNQDETAATIRVRKRRG
jgi:hypothetical protein